MQKDRLDYLLNCKKIYIKTTENIIISWLVYFNFISRLCYMATYCLLYEATITTYLHEIVFIKYEAVT